jgi:translation initiation factor IF-3
METLFWRYLCILMGGAVYALPILFFTEVLNINAKELPINEEIRDKELRIVDTDGSQLGIMSSRDAQKLANEKGLDLVKIAPQATPPVCKIMDFGKYCFEQAKKEKEARKNQHIVSVKEIYLSMKIDTHDFETKANHAIRFLKEGDKVKVAVKFRGREMAHTSLGYGVLDRFNQYISEYGSVEKPPKLEGRNMSMFISPKLAK